MNATIPVLIVDSSEIVRAGLAGVLGSSDGIDVVGETADLQEAVSLAGELQPDVVILDLGPAESPRIDLVTQIVQVCPHSRLLVFTSKDCVASMKQLFAAGVKGYLIKEATNHEITAAVKAVAAGRAFFSLTWQEEMFRAENRKVETPDSLKTQEGLHGLSEREAEVLSSVARGMTNQQIAEQLFLSVKTVETYRSRLARKIGARCRADIYEFARSAGLLSGEVTTADAG